MVFGLIPPEIWNNFLLAFKYVYLSMPVWLPAIFLILFFNAWVYWRRTRFWQKEGSVLLEIKLPREISKSPAAMEVVLQALHQTGGEGTWINRIWKGQTRSHFSLEIASIGGNIRFFIWTKPKHRNFIESQIYSQYPGVEIYEAEDYTKPFYYNPEVNGLYATEFKLTQPDPYPIKTYIDYGLDRDPKEEFKIDPITPLIEFLGSLTSGHNIWFQIIIRAHKKRRLADIFGEKEDSWKDEAKAEMAKIVETYKPKDKTEYGRFPTKGETDLINSLERSVLKYPFDCGIRAIYIADKDKFDGANIGGVLGMVKQFGSNDKLNGFRPNGWLFDFDYPWQEWFNDQERIKTIALQEYKLRRFFYSPWRNKKYHSSKPFILNTEELATVFHFPGSVSSTPTFEKIPSLKSKAPSNLPI
ncbi:MAG: hypothetical protein V1896_02510 [Candidatus Zambryskibacteria bacterium]